MLNVLVVQSNLNSLDETIHDIAILDEQRNDMLDGDHQLVQGNPRTIVDNIRGPEYETITMLSCKRKHVMHAVIDPAQAV